jgi:hypothetical protein
MSLNTPDLRKAKGVVPIVRDDLTDVEKPFYVGIHGIKDKISWRLVTLDFVHIHTGLELGAVISGKGILSLNDQQYKLEPNDIFFLDSTIKHNTAGSDLVEVIAHIATESVINAHVNPDDSRLLQPFLSLRAGLSPIIKNRSDIVALLKQAARHYSSQDAYAKQKAWLSALGAIVEIARSVQDWLAKSLGPSLAAGNAQIMAALEYINRIKLRDNRGDSSP